MLDGIKNANIVLFDFDGLLVNTEHLHFRAYQKMCEWFGHKLSWDFTTFCDVAHRSSTGLRDKMYQDLPGLFQKEPDWKVAYDIKKKFYKELLLQGEIQLMPGVGRLLSWLDSRGVKRAVVTHSPKEQTDLIKEQIPLLHSIPLWITREDYRLAKPEPDGYLKALAHLSEPGDVAIGFEDTLRGYCALEGAEVEGVVVSSVLSEHFRLLLEEKGAKIIPNFESLIF